MGYALAHYNFATEYRSDVFREIEERMMDSCLTHYASWLLDRGLRDESELEDALHKAMSVLCAARLSCHHHFKKVYVSQQGQIKTDWLVSDLGMRMIIMHADAGNPVMAALQVQLLSEKH